MRNVEDQLAAYGDALERSVVESDPVRRPPLHRWGLVAAAVIIVVLGTGVLIQNRADPDQLATTTPSDDGTATTMTTTTPSTAGETGPIVWSHSDTSDGAVELAPIGGALIYDPVTRCLSLMRFDPYPVVWPQGTVALEGEVGVVLPDGTVARPGDGVFGDGTYETTEITSYFDIPPECMGPTGQVISFNANATTRVLRP